MDFFALVGGHQRAVFRLNLDADLQARLTTRFQEQTEEFFAPDLAVIPFARENFQPDESEVLEIAQFDLPEEIFDPIANPVGWPTLPADADLLTRVYSIIGFDAASDTVVFQVIQRQQRLTTDTFGILLSRDTFTKLQSPGLLLGPSAHAVYRAGSIRFKSLWWLKQVLDISQYYQAATNADIDRFAQSSALVVEDVDQLKEKAGQWVRTRVAYIMDSGILENYPVPELCAKAQEFGVQLQTVKKDGADKILIPQDARSLRSVLKFLEEEYYAGPITGAAYEANSKRRLT